MSVSVLWRLARRPGWLLGILAMLCGFVVHCIAITVGGLAHVQPVLVAELPLTIVLASWVFGVRPRRREWLAILLQATGLAAVLGCLAPVGGDPLQVPMSHWITGIAVNLVIVAVLTFLGYHDVRERRAAWLGVATGSAFGLNSALVSGAGAAATHGANGLFGAWQTYAVAIVGVGSFVLLQGALKAGKLVASQPGFTLANPVVAVTWGLLALGEHGRGGVYLAGSLGGAACIGLGTILLARSPLLDSARGESSSRTPVRTG